MQDNTENNSKFNNSLLTKVEFQYLTKKNESKQHAISKNSEYKMRSMIRKK
jgi:hypothetical protein